MNNKKNSRSAVSNENKSVADEVAVDPDLLDIISLFVDAGDEFLCIAARYVCTWVVNIHNFYEVIPLWGIDIYYLKLLQIEIFTVVAKESRATEQEHSPAQCVFLNFLYLRNLGDIYLGDVEYALNLYLIVQQNYTSRNGENHQGYKSQYEWYKPRREESARV